MADVTSRVAYLGNPASTYAANNSKTWSFALNPWDLQAFSNKLYVGVGNYANSGLDAHAGPLPLLSYDPATGAFSGTGVGATTIGEESIERFCSLNGSLVIPGIDPTANDNLNYYKLESGTWRTYSASTGGASSQVHTFDMAYWESNYWAFGVTNFRQASLGSGGTGGVTWTSVFSTLGRSYKAFTLGADLYTTGLIPTTGGTGGSGNYLYKCASGGTTFAAVSGSNYAYLIPGVAATAFSNLNALPMLRTENFPNSSTVVYLVAQEEVGYPVKDVVKWTSGGSPTSILSSLTAINAGWTPTDLLVADSTLYILGYYTSGSDTVVSVVRTTDLSTFTEVFSFKPNAVTGSGYTGAQTFARSFEKIGSTWYFGLGSAYSASSAGQPANVGAILAYTPPWEMAAGNPQRTGYSAAESLGSSWSVAWRAEQHLDHNILDKVHAACSPCVSAGHVVQATLSGKVRSYATSLTKTLQWTATPGAPIISAPCADGTNVYVADTYGQLWAYKLSDGSQASGWTNPVQVTDGQWAPITGALLYANGQIICGGHDGKLYGINPANGATVWSRQLGGPIYQGAAWSNATGTGLAVVGAMDAKVYAVNTATGAQAWATSALPYASGFPQYWPVIDESRQKVLIRPLTEIPMSTNGLPTSPIRALSVSDWTSDSAMTTVLAAYDANPSNYAKTLYVLSLVDGSETASDQVLHAQYCNTMNGANPPVVIDRQGYYVVPMPKPSIWANGGNVHGWVRINPATRKVADGLIDSTYNTVGQNGNGFGAPDENMAASACANGVLTFHIQEINAHYTGFYDQDNAQWRPISGVLGGTTIMFFNTGGGGAMAPAISGGMVYHNKHAHTLNAIRTA